MGGTILGELTVERLLRLALGHEEGEGPRASGGGAVHSQQVELEDLEDDDVVRHVGAFEEVEVRPPRRWPGEQPSDQVLYLLLGGDGFLEGLAELGEVVRKGEGVDDARMPSGSDRLFRYVVHALHQRLIKQVYVLLR